MLPLIEMMMKAGGGEAMQNMARQFGLSQQQAMSAVEALLPAFSVGLKRNAADPMGLGAMMQTWASGNHANYFDNAAQAFNPAGIADGNNVLGQLFGSKDVSRAVAAQAAAATGIGTDILKQMLPAMASMLMGGLAKQTSGQMNAAGMGAGGNVFGQVIEGMMKQYGGQGQQQQAPADNPLGKILEGMFGGGAGQQAQPQASSNPWGDILEQMTNAATGQQRQTQNPAGSNPLEEILKQMTGGQAGGQSANPMGDNPLGKILEGMFGGGQAAPQEEDTAQQPQRQTRTPTTSNNPFGDALNDMFKTGQKTQDNYQKGMESIFDQFKQGMDRNR